METAMWMISDPGFEADRICQNYRIWPWNGHRRFAYDLVRFLQPERFIELGTYWGTSFFAFCQAVKDFNLKTECIAVDTWEGDEHTGPYDLNAFGTFQKIVQDVFDGIRVHTLPMTFENALSRFRNASIDILHIDGCHDYEPVQNDYRLWLPKLKENGIILFHDVADIVPYESVRFWKEISRHYPSFSFQHSWGLGVLFPKGDYYYQQMKASGFDDKVKIYEYRSDLDYALTRIRILKDILDSDKRERAHLDQKLEALLLEMETLRQANDHLQSRIQHLESSRVLRFMKNFRSAVKIG